MDGRNASKPRQYASPPPALLIIDMQQGIQRVSTPRNNPGAEACIAQLLEHWRNAGLPLVHIRHISRQADSVFAPGQSGALFQPALAPSSLSDFLASFEDNPGTAQLMVTA